MRSPISPNAHSRPQHLLKKDGRQRQLLSLKVQEPDLLYKISSMQKKKVCRSGSINMKCEGYECCTALVFAVMCTDYSTLHFQNTRSPFSIKLIANIWNDKTETIMLVEWAKSCLCQIHPTPFLGAVFTSSCSSSCWGKKHSSLAEWAHASYPPVLISVPGHKNIARDCAESVLIQKQTCPQCFT